jgi:hypothetical protein
LMCLSRQFAETFSCPPRNHFAQGRFHSRTRSHFLVQSRLSACSAQKPSKSLLALSQIPGSFWFALFWNRSGGGKRLFSSSRASSEPEDFTGDRDNQTVQLSGPASPINLSRRPWTLHSTLHQVRVEEWNFSNPPRETRLIVLVGFTN